MITFSSSSSTAFAISFFCSKTESNSNFGTLALITEEMQNMSSVKEVSQGYQLCYDTTSKGILLHKRQPSMIEVD